MLRVHYHRFDNDYEGVGLWTWPAEDPHMPFQAELLPRGWDDFGPWFELDPAAYSRDGEANTIGLLPRLRHDWRYKDGDDRLWSPGYGNEVWLLSGDAAIYTDCPDTSPRIQAAFLDAETRIAIKLSHSIELPRLDVKDFSIHMRGRAPVPLAAVRPLDVADARSRILALLSSEPLDYATPYTVHAKGYRPARVQLRDILIDPRRFLFLGEMGAIHTPASTTFRLFAPEADQVQLVLYNETPAAVEREVIAMHPLDRGVWEVRVSGDLHGRGYRVRVRSDDAQTGREVLDPYCRAATGHDGHGLIADVRRLDPPNFRPLKRPPGSSRPTDAIIWELHVRDFTISPSSGVSEPLRGKYLGAAQPATRLPGTDIRTCIDHLLELGVTHVQIMPIQDFDNDENSTHYQWGYMPVNWFSPEGWYATNPRSMARVTEAKAMIRAFHDAGLRVILDVVFNHTAPIASFEAIAPRYYHRRKHDGSLWNGSACGNEFRTHAPMARKLIVDACRYWVEEYGVNGFRFDLMGLIDLDTLKQVRDAVIELDENILLYGEPWSAGDPNDAGISRITSKFMITGTGIAAFNDHLRDDIRGEHSAGSPGYVQTGARREGIKRGLQGAIYDWSWHPADAVQYVSCHDDLTLWDKLAASAPEATEEERLRMHLLALGILLVSQGAVLLHAGVEMLRTKNGEANSYNSPDEINMLDWARKRDYPHVFEFVKNMIALRRAHPVFRLARREEVESRLHFHDRLCPTEHCIAMALYGGQLDGEPWENILVLINPEKRGLEFTLQKGRWNIHAIGQKVSPDEPIEQVEGKLLVPGRCMAILAS